MRLTEGPGDGARLSREAVSEGFGTVIAAGGDGTVNEVLAGLGDSAVRMGVIPLGTMNVFAREHGIPLDWEDALGRILRRNPKTVDLGLANGRPFAQLAGAGFDARVVRGVSRSAKRRWGAGAYILSAIRQLARRHPVLSVSAEGLPSRDAIWVLVGLGRFYGGGFPAFPMARAADGLMDVVVVRSLEFWKCAAALAVLPWGWHTRLPGIEYLQTRCLKVEGAEPWEVDGELAGAGPVEFSLRPGALRLLV